MQNKCRAILKRENIKKLQKKKDIYNRIIRKNGNLKGAWKRTATNIILIQIQKCLML